MEGAGEDATGSRVGSHTDLEEVTIAGLHGRPEAGEVTARRLAET